MSLKDELALLMYKYGAKTVRDEIETVYIALMNKYAEELKVNGYMVDLSGQPQASEKPEKPEQPEQPEQPEKPEKEAQEKKFSITEYKRWQRQKEKERKQYMKDNNIKVKDLFTKENITQWLNEGKSYAQIAREYLGVKQDTVSVFAKQNGIEKKKGTSAA